MRNEADVTIGDGYRFAAGLWRYPGDAGWFFVTLPEEIADEIAARTAGSRRGFGSVPVSVSIGASRWQTSIFPDKTAGSYVLPVKKSVRQAEGLRDGDPCEIALTLR